MSTSLEKFVPPWTVRRQVRTESLLESHSGISTDILLFSDIHLSLTHHYRVHRRRLPHIAFRKDYLARLRGFVTRPAGQSRRDTDSPVASSPVSSPCVRSVEQDSETPRLTRRGRRRMWPAGVLLELIGDIQVVTAQEASDMQGALVYDCRPPLLPVSGGHGGVAFASDGCVGQPGGASPGGLDGDRWCEPGNGCCSGAGCCSTDKHLYGVRG